MSSLSSCSASSVLGNVVTMLASAQLDDIVAVCLVLSKWDCAAVVRCVCAPAIIDVGTGVEVQESKLV